MKTHFSNTLPRRAAFTLMELLVVISVIALLAAIIIPAGLAIKNKAAVKKAQTELKQVSELIDRYKTRFGYYPPDHYLPTGKEPLTNSLYFELVGSTFDSANNVYTSLDGAGRVTVADCQAAFGVGSILNCTKSSGEESKPAERFLKQLKPNQYYQYAVGGSTIRLLTSSVPWPQSSRDVLTGVPYVNPFRYLKNGTNNAGSYDLWVDVVIAGKTNRISNWSDVPQTVFY